MDRFKVRGWNKKEKNLTYINDMYWFDNVIFMQCTGLSDKNGKLIYEGDILRYGCSKASSIMLDVLIPDDDVKWNEETAAFNLNKGSVEDMYEIIGNIYENPGLLKGDK